MPLKYQIKNIRGREGAEITGYEGDAARIEVPCELDGRPVLAIGKSAFSDLPELKEVRVPDTVLVLGAFAFNYCDRLKKLTLPDSIEDYYDGATRTCRSLTDITVNMSHRRFGLLRSLLADGTGRKRIELVFDTGRLSLVFPEYSNDYVIDTLAKTHHATLTGCGNAYRECVRKDGINLKEYDSLFSRAQYTDERAAMEIAVGRLMYPAELKDAEAGAYRQYIGSHWHMALEMAVEDENEGWMELLMKEGLLDEEGVGAALRLVSGKRMTVIAGQLLEYRRERFVMPDNVKLSLADPGDIDF